MLLAIYILVLNSMSYGLAEAMAKDYQKSSGRAIIALGTMLAAGILGWVHLRHFGVFG